MTMPLQPKTTRLPYIKIDKSRTYGAAALRAVAPYPNRLEYQMKLAAQAFLNNRSQTLFDPGLNPVVAERIRMEYGINDEDFKDIMVSTGKIVGGTYGTYKGAVLGAKAGSAVAAGLSAAGTALGLGQLGPQVALPEELITVPLAFIGAYFGMKTGAKTGGAVAGLISPSGVVAASELIRDTLISSVEKQGPKGALIGASMLIGSSAGAYVGGKLGYAGLGAAIGGKVGTSTAIGLSTLVTGQSVEEVGLMTGLNMVGNTMDQFSGAMAIKASIIAMQEKSSINEMINKAYGEHETGFTQLDFSRIRKNTGMDLGTFGNGIIDFAGELLTDPGIWYSNLEAKNSKYARNTAAEWVVEQSYRGGTRGGVFGTLTGKGENFYRLIGLNSAKRIGEIIKESAVSKMTPKTLFGKLAETFQPNIKKFDGYEAFKREMLLTNSDTSKYLMARFRDAEGKVSARQIDNFLKDIYKEIETGIINRMDGKALATITRHGAVRNKFGNMLEELEAKGLINNTMDLNSMLSADLKRMRISYTSKDFNSFIKNYRAFKLSDATDNALAQGTMFMLNPTMVAFGYGRRKIFKLLSHPASFRTHVKNLMNRAGINKVIDIKEIATNILFKKSSILQNHKKKIDAEIKSRFYDEPLKLALEQKVELLNETIRQLDEIDAEAERLQQENSDLFNERKTTIQENWKETKRRIKSDFRKRNKEIYDETQTRIDEILKEYDLKKKEIDDKIKAEREEIQVTVFHNGENVRLDDTLVEIFKEDIKRLTKLETKRPLTQDEREELNYKRSALGTLSWVETMSEIAEDIKLGINQVEHLLTTLTTYMKSMENFWNFEHRNERFEDEISSLDAFRESFFENKKGIPDDVLNELWNRLENREGRKKFIGLYNETYKNKNGKYKFDEYWRRRDNIQKRIVEYDSLKESERYARFIEYLLANPEFVYTANKYQEWIAGYMETLKALVGAEPTKLKLLKQLENKIKNNFTLSVLDSTVRDNIKEYNRNGLDDDLQEELTQVIANLQQDKNFAIDNNRNTSLARPGSAPMMFDNRVYEAFDKQLRALGLLSYREIQEIGKTMIDRGDEYETFVKEFDGVNQRNFYRMMSGVSSDDTLRISNDLRDHFRSYGIGFKDIISTDFQSALIMEYFKQSDDEYGYAGSEYGDFFAGMSKGNLEEIATILYGKDGENPLEGMMYSTAKAMNARLNYTKIHMEGESLDIIDFIEKYGKEVDLLEFQDVEANGIKNTRGQRLNDFYAKRKQVEILNRVRDRYYYLQMNQSIVQTEVMFKDHASGTLGAILDILNGDIQDGIGKVLSDILSGNAINSKSKIINEIRVKLEDSTASNNSKMNILERSGVLQKFLNNSYEDGEVIVEGFYGILKYMDRLHLLDVDENGARKLDSVEFEQKLEYAEQKLYDKFKKYMDHDVLEVLIRETMIETYRRYNSRNTASTKLNAQFTNHTANQIIDLFLNVKKSWEEQINYEKASESDARKAAQEGLQIEKEYNRVLLEDMDEFINNLGMELRMPFIRAKSANDYLKTHLFTSADIQQKVNWNQLFNVNDLVFKNSPFILRQPRSASDAARAKGLYRFLYNAEGRFDDLDYETRTKILGEEIKEAPGPDGYSTKLDPITEEDAWRILSAGEDLPKQPEQRNVSKSIAALSEMIGALKDSNDDNIDVYEFMKLWKVLDDKGMDSYHAYVGLEYFKQVVFPNRSSDEIDFMLDNIASFTQHNKYMRDFSADQIRSVLGHYMMIMDTPNNIKNVPEFKKALLEANKQKRQAHQEMIDEYKKIKGYSKRKDVDTELHFIMLNVPKDMLAQYLLRRFGIKNLNGKLRRVIKYAESLKDGDQLDYTSEEIRTLTSYLVRNMETEGKWNRKVRTNLDIEKERVRNELNRDDLTDAQRRRLEKRRMQLRDKKYLRRTNHRYNWSQRNRVDWVAEYIEGELDVQRNADMQGAFDEAGEKYQESYDNRSERFVEELEKQSQEHQENYREMIETQERIREEAKAKKEIVNQELKRINDEFGELNPDRVRSVQSKAFELLTKTNIGNMLQFMRYLQSKGVNIDGGIRKFVNEYKDFLETSREDGLLMLKDRNYYIEDGKQKRSTKTIEVDWNTMTFVNKWGKVQDIPEWMILQDAELRTQSFKEVLNDAIIEKLGDPEFEYVEGTTKRKIQDKYNEEVIKAFDNKSAQNRRVANLEKMFSHTLEDLAWYFTRDGEIKFDEMLQFLNDNPHLRLMGIFKDNDKGSRGYGSYQRDKQGKPILDEDGNPKLRSDSFEMREGIREKDIENFLSGKYDIDKPVAKQVLFNTADELEAMMKDLVEDWDTDKSDAENIMEGLREFSIGIMPVELMKRAQKISFNKYQLPGPLQHYYTGFERVQKFDMLLNSSFHPRNLLDVIRKNSQMVNSVDDMVDYVQWGLRTGSVYFDLRSMQKNDFEMGTLFYKIKEGAADAEFIERAEPLMNKMLEGREPELREELELLRQDPDKNKYRIQRLEAEYNSIQEIRLDWANKKYIEAMSKMYEHHYSKIGFTHYVKLMEMDNIRNTVVSKLRKFSPKYMLANEETKAKMVEERVQDRFNLLNIANQYQKTSAATDQTRYLRNLFDGDLGKHPLGKMMEAYKEDGFAKGNEKLMHYLAQENPIAKNYMKIGTTIEQIGRLHGFMLERHMFGTEYNKAIANSLQRHYDYSDRGAMETMATVAVPFIAFPTRNALFWAEQFRDASKIRRWYHLMNAVWGSYEGDEENEYIQYARINGYVPIGNSLVKLGDSRAGAMGMLLNPGQTIYNRLNPILKAPIETLRGNGTMSENIVKATPFIRRIPQVMENYKATKNGASLKAMLPGIFGTLYSDSNYNSPAFRYRRNVYNELYNFKGNRRQLSTNAYYRVRQIQYQQQQRRYI